MEIDTPGHTGSIYQSHPDYVTCYGASPWYNYANEPPAGQIRFDLPEVQQFIAGIFDGASSLLKSAYFGTGGDELNQNCMVCMYILLRVKLTG
jgi:hexosaminidase